MQLPFVVDASVEPAPCEMASCWIVGFESALSRAECPSTPAGLDPRYPPCQFLTPLHTPRNTEINTAGGQSVMQNMPAAFSSCIPPIFPTHQPNPTRSKERTAAQQHKEDAGSLQYHCRPPLFPCHCLRAAAPIPAWPGLDRC